MYNISSFLIKEKRETVKRPQLGLLSIKYNIISFRANINGNKNLIQFYLLSSVALAYIATTNKKVTNTLT